MGMFIAVYFMIMHKLSETDKFIIIEFSGLEICSMQNEFYS